MLNDGSRQHESTAAPASLPAHKSLRDNAYALRDAAILCYARIIG